MNLLHHVHFSDSRNARVIGTQQNFDNGEVSCTKVKLDFIESEAFPSQAFSKKKTVDINVGL